MNACMIVNLVDNACCTNNVYWVCPELKGHVSWFWRNILGTVFLSHIQSTCQHTFCKWQRVSIFYSVIESCWNVLLSHFLISHTLWQLNASLVELSLSRYITTVPCRTTPKLYMSRTQENGSGKMPLGCVRLELVGTHLCIKIFLGVRVIIRTCFLDSVQVLRFVCQSISIPNSASMLVTWTLSWYCAYRFDSTNTCFAYMCDICLADNWA